MDLSTRDGRRKQGERIKRAARSADLSIENLAIRIGCSRALLYQYISGAALVQTDRLQLIANVLDKPLLWFFDSEDLPLDTQTAPDDKLSVSEKQRIQERIAHLQTLVSAYESPVNWRGVTDTCQQLVPLLEHENARREIAETLLTQGEALIQLQDLSTAKEKLQAARAVFQEVGRPDRALACLQSLGQINVTLGRTDEALHLFQQVADGERWTQRWQGALSLGATHEVLGNYRQAAEMFEKARRIVDENEDPRQADPAILYIDANWSNLSLDWGDYQEAAANSERCILLAQRLGNQDQYLEALLTRGVALAGMQEYATACTEIQRALNVAALTSDQAHSSLALSCRSLCLTACMQPLDALTDGKEALAIALRSGAHRAEMLAQRALAEAYLAGNNRTEARYHLDQAEALAAGLRLRLPQAEVNLLRARWEFESGQLAEADSSARAALAIAIELEAKPVRHDAELLLARVALTRGAWDEAIALAAAAEPLAVAMHAQTWKARAIIAEAQVRMSRFEEARVSFMSALESLQENRQHCTQVSGVDTFLERTEALDLWQQWLQFLVTMRQETQAREQAEAADWPPLQQWYSDTLGYTLGQASTS